MNPSLLVRYLIILSTILCVGCGDKGSKNESATIPPLTDSIVNEAYNFFVTGDYHNYVLQMQSVSGKPDEYVRGMEILYKQHAAELRDNYEGIKSFKVNRLRTKEGDASATAFLEVTYGNGTEEEIMLTFIYDSGHWKLR